LGGTAFDDAPDGDSGWVDPEGVPHRIGRFVVLKLLGSGAMGVVYAAFDEDLDRKVAVKLLRRSSRSQENQRARLVREAQALAKLSHPNVVQVYEVGVYGERVFVAMEFLAGDSMRDWLRADPPLAAVLDKMVQAGRGLEAAHKVGLVHRDFKPENVLIDAEGRVRVLDFGLARAADDMDVTHSSLDMDEELARISVSGADSSRPGSFRSGEGLTRTGALMGTPAYMSPEQFNGEPATAASDQFSFCIALWEALFATRPFAGRDAKALGKNVREGKRRPVPRDSTVPGWMRKALDRGLAIEPDQRWPSMTELLDELTRDRAGKRRLLLWAAGGAGLSAALALTVGSLMEDPNRSACQSVLRELDGTWNDGARESMRAAFSESQLSYAAETSERVLSRLDDYASRWIDSRVQVCEARAGGGASSPQLLDRTVACLDRRRAGLEAIIDALSAGDAATVERAVEAVAKLKPIEVCSDRERLLAAVPPPDDARTAERVADLRERLERATAISGAGRYEDSLALVEGLLVEARELEYPPLIAEIKLALGDYQKELGDPKQAEDTYADAFTLALRVGDTETAAGAASASTNLLGYVLQRHDEALVWARAAEGLSQRVGEESEEHAQALDSIGSVLFRQGKFEEALPYYERALEIHIKRHGETNDSVASDLNNVAAVNHYLGRREEAQVMMARAVEVAESNHGPSHPQVGLKVQNLATFALYAWDLETARKNYQRAHDIAAASRGESSSHTAVPLGAIGKIDLEEGKLDDAEPRLRRALELIQAVHGEGHLDVSTLLVYVGELEAARGDRESAMKRFELAHEIVEKTADLDHPFAAKVFEAIAKLEMEKDPARARSLLERAIVIREKRFAGTPQLAKARVLLAKVAVAQGDATEGQKQLELARAYFRGNPRMRAELRQADALAAEIRE
jgi:tetratricopeptide (TPR) repeat protein/tRNA A-37 threonylcarbamoyl transferase component Bud32